MYINNNNLLMWVYVITVWILVVVALQIKKAKQPGSKKAKRVAFFHPFCNDAGGGQKVLWSMIEALLQKSSPQSPSSQYENQPILSIYTLQADEHEILTKVSNRFNIKLFDYAHRIQFIKISGKHYLTPKSKFTMLCHILLPMIYCFKCIWKYQPDIFYDTTGFAFNCLLVKLLLPKCECRAYVHYPFISEDMVAKIRERRVDFNNNSDISHSNVKTNLKLIYYRIILLFYKIVRISISAAQANSTWTYDHMIKLWGNNIVKLYPPCSITEMLKFDKNYENKQLKIISLAQFRPQKNHTLQINVIHHLLDNLKQLNKNKESQQQYKLHLYICGTTRGEEDEKLLQSLKGKVQLLKLNEHISFCVNMKYIDLLQKLKECNYAIHSMEAQHFGISIVQMLAAGCLVVAHNSAGPKFDIIKNQRFLAQAQKQYQEKLFNIFIMSAKEKRACSDNFRERMLQFGESSFKENFRRIFNEGKKKN